MMFPLKTNRLVIISTCCYLLLVPKFCPTPFWNPLKPENDCLVICIIGYFVMFSTLMETCSFTTLSNHWLIHSSKKEVLGGIYYVLSTELDAWNTKWTSLFHHRDISHSSWPNSDLSDSIFTCLYLSSQEGKWLNMTISFSLFAAQLLSFTLLEMYPLQRRWTDLSTLWMFNIKQQFPGYFKI